MPVELVVSRRDPRLAATLLAASACASAVRVPTPAERHPIRLDAAYPAGTRYTVDVRTEKERRLHTERAGSPPEDRVERGAVHVRARVEVLERDEAHLRERIVVEVAEEDSYYRHPFLLRAGQVFDVVRRPGATDARDGRGEALAPEMRRSFGDIFDLAWPAPPGDDDSVFGSPQPQPVGARWPMHSTGPGTRGTVRFVGLEPCGGERCIHLRAEVTSAPARLTAPAPGAIEQGEIATTLDLRVPVDPRRAYRRSEHVSRESHTITDPSRGLRRVTDGRYTHVEETTPGW